LTSPTIDGLSTRQQLALAVLPVIWKDERPSAGRHGYGFIPLNRAGTLAANVAEAFTVADLILKRTPTP